MSDDRLYPLYKLSRIDIDLAALRGRAASLDTGKRHRAKAKQVQEENSDLLEALQTKREVLSKALTDLEQSRARYQRDYDRLYSGTITNPKDIQMLQHELESLEKHIQELEPKIVELTQERDEIQTLAADIEARIHKLIRRGTKLKQQAETDRAEIESAFNELAEKRKALVGTVSRELRDPYEAAHRKTKAGGLAVVTADKKCEGCGTAVPVKSIERTRDGALVSCEACGRLLFVLMPRAEFPT